ncbi:LuxR C-terminal-related transcriptional regulator [Dehalococcoides mccartyi]|uniref:helix-turn-helix transcriptional regulator n=1 Tax=Dehalococcoides mccartyi TaxID=61435 RepID=UPI000870C96B|nr:LuxR C-terminal-related transcriptional regulator [Dehalococcoides mccartyi]AOV99409.1 transcriptional regulator [Dehalococcoides mccartyi]
MVENVFGTFLKIVIHPSYEWLEKAKEYNISHRELEVLALMTEGHNNKEIASLLGIQYQSVKNHWHTLSKKIKAQNSAQAMVILMSLNVIGWINTLDNTENSKMTQAKYMQKLREVLNGHDSGTDKRTKETLRKFMVEHGLYDELYKDRIEELRNVEKPIKPCE